METMKIIYYVRHRRLYRRAAGAPILFNGMKHLEYRGYDSADPAYQNDPERVYGFLFAGQNVRFRVGGKRLTVVEVALAPAQC